MATAATVTPMPRASSCELSLAARVQLSLALLTFRLNDDIVSRLLTERFSLLLFQLSVRREKLQKIHPNATYTCDPFDGEHMHASIVHLGKPVTHGADCCYCLPNKLYTDVNHFVSITDGFWWAGMTFTTVGYGDKFPRTWGGRIIAVITMFVGVFVSSSFAHRLPH